MISTSLIFMLQLFVEIFSQNEIINLTPLVMSSLSSSLSRPPRTKTDTTKKKQNKKKTIHII